jgi:hypothetical protein
MGARGEARDGGSDPMCACGYERKRVSALRV